MMPWMERHMIFTALLVVVLVALFIAVTLKVFLSPVDIPTGTVSAYGIFFGVPALAVGLWQFRTRVIDARKGVTYESIRNSTVGYQGGPVGSGWQDGPHWGGGYGSSYRDVGGPPRWGGGSASGMYGDHPSVGDRSAGTTSRFGSSASGGGL